MRKNLKIYGIFRLPQHPLKITIIQECLDGKRREAAAPSHTPVVMKQEAALKAKFQPTKSNSKKDYPKCSAGWHNPETTGHIKSKCWMKLLPKPNAKAAANSHPDSGSNNNCKCMVASNVAGFCQALSANAHQECCFLDSGASHHMFSDKSQFAKYCARTTSIELADGSSLASAGEGFVHIKTKNLSTLTLKALHVPDLEGTLISFGRLFEQGCNVVQTSTNSFDLVRNKSVFLSAALIRGVCNIKLASGNQSQSSQSVTANSASATDINTLHRSAGHPNIKALKKLFPGLKAGKIVCDACLLSKSHRLPFPGSLPKASRPL